MLTRFGVNVADLLNLKDVPISVEKLNKTHRLRLLETAQAVQPYFVHAFENGWGSWLLVGR